MRDLIVWRGILSLPPSLPSPHGDRALAAEILGIDKSTLWRKVKRYEIDG